MKPRSEGFITIPVLISLLVVLLAGTGAYVMRERITQNKQNTICITGGCNGELCVKNTAKQRMTACVYRDEYRCLQYSRCEEQNDGSCGWTKTPQYTACLSSLIPTGPDLKRITP